jgi:hypothetical protein
LTGVGVRDVAESFMDEFTRPLKSITYIQNSKRVSSYKSVSETVAAGNNGQPVHSQMNVAKL